MNRADLSGINAITNSLLLYAPLCIGVAVLILATPSLVFVCGLISCLIGWLHLAGSKWPLNSRESWWRIGPAEGKQSTALYRTGYHLVAGGAFLLSVAALVNQALVRT